MIDRLLRRLFPVDLDLESPRFKRRVIYDRDGRDPYLARFYVTKAPTMPDGSEPFDSSGNPKPGVVWHDKDSRVAVYVHFFYRGDQDMALHNHPWRWAVSLILAGGYSEERRFGNEVRRSKKLPGTLNFIRDRAFHRVDLLNPERGAWSIFVVGPRKQDWSFWDRWTGKLTPWREFIAAASDRGTGRRAT